MTHEKYYVISIIILSLKISEKNSVNHIGEYETTPLKFNQFHHEIYFKPPTTDYTA